MYIKELSKGSGWEVFSTRLARGIGHLILARKTGTKWSLWSYTDRLVVC